METEGLWGGGKMKFNLHRKKQKYHMDLIQYSLLTENVYTITNFSCS